MKVKIKVPTSLSDIKLSQYQKFERTTKDSEDNVFIENQMIAIFCNLSDKMVKKILVKDKEGIINDISKVLEQKPKLNTIVKYNGIEYGFIPKLEDITIDEKADLDSHYRDIQTMDKAMSVLYRPITVKTKNGYLIEDYDVEADWFNESLDLTLDVVFGANVFFSNLMSDLLKFSQNFINQEVARSPKALQTLEQNGVGITAFTNSLEETFSGLTKLVNSNYSRV